MKTTDGVLLVLLALCLAVTLRGGGGILPVNVESPFPADGFYLLVAAESSQMSGAEMAANAKTVRDEPGLQRKVLDYDRRGVGEPWATALEWAREKSGGEPYYVLRRAGKASEGLLAGEPVEQLATLTAAITEAR